LKGLQNANGAYNQEALYTAVSG